MIFLYALLAAASVFAFCVGKTMAGIEADELTEDFYFAAPIAFGLFWPVGWVGYAPYLAAVYVLKHWEDRR